jgi:hypothetical protein
MIPAIFSTPHLFQRKPDFQRATAVKQVLLMVLKTIPAAD